MTQFNAPTYDIERPTGYCAFTGEPLTPNDPYMAALIDIDPQDLPAAGDNKQSASAVLGLRRLDVSWQAWQQGRRPDKMFCHWKATVAEPHKKKKLFVDDEVLLNLFRRLSDEEDAQRIAFRFVLGLILMRKKLLRYDGTKRKSTADEEGQPTEENWWQVTVKLDLSKGPLGKWNEDDRLEMLDPHLEDPHIEQITQQLGEVLEAEL